MVCILKAESVPLFSVLHLGNHRGVYSIPLVQLRSMHLELPRLSGHLH